MTYLLIALAGITLGYLIRSVDLTAREYRGDWADIFTDVPEPPSNVLDVDATWIEQYRRWRVRP